MRAVLCAILVCAASRGLLAQAVSVSRGDDTYNPSSGTQHVFTATIDGQPVYQFAPWNARLASNGYWEHYAPVGERLQTGGLGMILNTDAPHSTDYFCEWALDLPPGVYEFYGRWGNNELARKPGTVAVSSSRIVGNELRSPQAIKEIPLTVGWNETDKSVVVKKDGAEYCTNGVERIGEVTIWTGTKYLAVKDHALGGGAWTIMGPVYALRIRDVPKWQKYVGGDADTTGYFDELKPSDFRSLVVLPATALSSEVGYQTSNGGTPMRYVQLTFNDARNSGPDAHLTTFAWNIALGRNGGVTAQSVSWNGAVVGYQTGDMQGTVGANTGFLWRDTAQDVAGPPPLWGYQGEARNRERLMPKMTKNNTLAGGVSYFTSMDRANYLSRFPYSAVRWYWSPPYAVSRGVAGGASAGVAAYPFAATSGVQSGPYGIMAVQPSVYFSNSADPQGLYNGADVFLPGVAGYPNNASEVFNQVRVSHYPINLTHLELIAQGALSDPPYGAGERRFCELVGEFCRAARDEIGFTEYRAQVARGATDTVIIEDEEDPSASVYNPSSNPALNTNPIADNAATTKLKNALKPPGFESHVWQNDVDLEIPFNMGAGFEAIPGLGISASHPFQGSLHTRLENNTGGILNNPMLAGMITLGVSWRDFFRTLCVVVMAICFYRNVALKVMAHV